MIVKMKNRVESLVLGIAVILIGVGYAGNVFEIWDFSIFFEGFWTLFLIIPAVIDMFKSGFKAWNVLLLLLGVVLLGRSQDFFGFEMISELFWPAALIIFGLSIIFHKRSYKPSNFVSAPYQQDIYAVFSGKDVNVINEKLVSMHVKAVFGGIDLNLRHAIVDSDVNICVQCVFGGVDIALPPNVELIISDNSVFGGISNKSMPAFTENAKKIYLSAECIFGGIEIK